MGPIILSSVETATNADILQGTRLQTVPAGGVLTFSDSSYKHRITVTQQITHGCVK